MTVNAEPGLPPDTGAQGAPSAGALLKAARERQGMHIAALAAAIKVSPRKLEALEANRLDELPDATFARVLAQTVCRTLKIDARPVLDRLPTAGPLPLVPPDAGLNAPFRESSLRSLRSGDDTRLARVAMRPLLAGAAVLLVASVALYLLPPVSSWTLGPALPASAALPAAVMPAGGAASTASATSAASSVPSGMLPAAVQAASVASSSAGIAETVFSAPPAGTEAGATVPLLQVRVSEASWIEVRDARGTTLLARTVSPGEQVGLSGPEPLALVVGNAAATALVFRGRPVDLAADSRDNVARFQLP
jgi:cytoskeleton protein RodZ